MAWLTVYVNEQELLPRLEELRQVWQGVRNTLFDELGPEDDPSPTWNETKDSLS